MRRGVETPLGRVPLEKTRKSNRVFKVVTEVTLEKEGDETFVYKLSRTSYEPEARREIDRDFVEAEVAKILEGRDDLEGMTVLRVYVWEVSPVWREPYSWEPVR